MQVSRSLQPLLNLHIAKWKSCHGCELCTGRSQVLFFRGRIPCSVLFVTTGPDDISDTFGTPYPPGQNSHGAILDSIGPTVSWSVTNLVSCGPTTDDATTKPELKACWPKFLEYVKLASPKLLVCIGRVSHGHILNYMPDVVTQLGYRPILLSMNSLFWIGMQKDSDLEIQKAKLSIQAAVDKYL